MKVRFTTTSNISATLLHCSSDLLPKELVISFRNDLFNTAPHGHLLATPGITTVINPKENIYDTYLNMLSFKYYYEGNPEDMQPGFLIDERDNRRMIRDGNQSICGFNCRQARG
ncbi:MAG: hypothetical protein MZV63_02250 [Marinilabiliales bacterium]|nr:hypothetical protein [Marinilabiliales bacterium]